MFSQTGTNHYFPSHKDSLVAYIHTISEKKIAKFGSQYKKDIKEIVLDRQKSFLKNIDDSTYIFDPRISAYLKSVLREIYLANPKLHTNDFYFFLERSPLPNAASYGNGIFTVNLGLFNFVDTDDELAFMLCHEIAHFELAHSDKAMLNEIETLKSKAVKRKISQVNRQQYGKRKAYYDLVGQLEYNFMKRNRALAAHGEDQHQVTLEGQSKGCPFLFGAV